MGEVEKQTLSARIEAILEVLTAFAGLDFSKRAPISEAHDALDGIAVGLNMMAEEISATTASKLELEAAYRSLQDAQAQLIHAGKLAAIGQLAGGVAHEINNPAAAVVVSNALIGSEVAKLRSALARIAPPADTAREVSQIVARIEAALAGATDGMERIRSVVRDLRTFSRSDDETMEPVDLNDVVRAACSIARVEIRHRARLVQDLGTIPPVWGNRGRLGQVVTNLLVNAGQAIREGAVEGNEVRVATDVADGAVRLVVTDTGEGIPANLKARIFEPFFTTKPPDVGTGLGLSLVAEILRKHGGRATVSSESGKGSRFEITLQATAPREAPAVSHTGPEPARCRVLLIDDEEVVLTSVAALLGTLHEVVTAGSGERALEVLHRDQRFDVVVCDLVMPAIDGPALHDAIGKKWPQLLPRVIFCSGGAFTDRMRRFVSTVKNPILEKPFGPDDLFRLVEEVRRGA